jgi:hypothetical protein
MGEKPKRCWFPTLMILMSIRLILYASISFRAAPKVIHTIFSEFPSVKNQPVPSHKSIGRWLTRIGLYKLKLPKEHADDWALIIDNSIQIGTKKCLVIIGTRLSKRKWKPLEFADVEVLLIEMHDNTDKNVICRSLEKAQEKVGKVVMICADDGPDLRSGIKLFCKKHKVGRIFDTIHKIGTFLKKTLEKDPKWQAFVSAAAEAKKKMQQTSAAHLAPPSQRTKSRFLNIEILTRWAVDALIALEDPQHSDRELLEKYCGWLFDYKELIECLKQLDLISKHVRKHIRENGLSLTTGQQVEVLLQEAMRSMPFNLNACQYAGRLIDFFREHAKIVPRNQIWIGSSEIIESLFGKLKCLERNHHKGGFTSLVLGMAACVGSLDHSVVHEAIVMTKTKDVEAWTKEQIGKTLLSKRREAFGGWRKTKKVRKNMQESAGVYLKKAAGF